MSSRESGTITNRFYVKNWVYKGGVKKSHVRCLPPIYIYIRPLFISLYVYIGEVNSGQDFFNFNLIYTKFYADFRSGLRFGCYQRTFWRYVIYLALSDTLPSSVAFFLDRTSKVTTPQDRHIFQNGFFSRTLPDLYIHNRHARFPRAHLEVVFEAATKSDQTYGAGE